MERSFDTYGTFLETMKAAESEKAVIRLREVLLELMAYAKASFDGYEWPEGEISYILTKCAKVLEEC